MKFTKSIFKAYDIRGVSGDELTAEVVHGVGRALADFLPAGQVVVGRDMRPDSSELAEALKAGLIQQGRIVLDIGLVSSDMIYFAVGKYNLAGGAMITASHNPGRYNGIKLTAKGVMPIGQDTGLAMIRDTLSTDTYKTASPGGKVIKKDITSEWVEHALGISGDIKQLKVGMDFGNGMAAIDLPELKRKTPLEIKPLYTKLDGTFPNHPANPLVRDNLTDLMGLVVDEKLNLGVAFDGDGDRAFLVDEKGEPVGASQLGALLAWVTLQDNPGATILYNAITSDVVPDVVNTLGGKAIRTRVGHSFIKAKMHETGALLAVEHSGHFYFKDNFYADSGLVAALKAISIVSQSRKSLSEIISPFERYADSGEINIKSSDKNAVLQKIKTHYQDSHQDELDGLTARYDNWWFNLRLSNTEPYLRLNVESSNESLTKEKTAELLDLIRA